MDDVMLKVSKMVLTLLNRKLRRVSFVKENTFKLQIYGCGEAMVCVIELEAWHLCLAVACALTYCFSRHHL